MKRLFLMTYDQYRRNVCLDGGENYEIVRDYGDILLVKSRVENPYALIVIICDNGELEIEEPEYY